MLYTNKDTLHIWLPAICKFIFEKLIRGIYYIIIRTGSVYAM